jgi:hypothetical protein
LPMLLLAGPIHVFDFVAVADMLVNAVPSGSGLDIIEDRWSVSDGAIFFPWVPWEAELDRSVPSVKEKGRVRSRYR